MEGLRAGLPPGILDRFTSGYGVLFPDCDFSSEGVEWDRAMVADKRSSRDLEGWLCRLFAYWRGRAGSNARPDVESLATLQSYLRPHVDLPAGENEVPLFDQVEDARQRVERFTDDQMRMADVAEANARVLCAGGAGTGKTFLAERLARRWAEVGMKVAFVCRSPWLRHFLASRLSIPGLTVSLIDGVRLDCRRAGLAHFDALIVDEGQDLFEMRCLETLDRVLEGGLDAGRWCWFHDLNNQSLTRRFEQRCTRSTWNPSTRYACRSGSTAATRASFSNGFKMPSVRTSASGEPATGPPCAFAPPRTGAIPPNAPPARSASWWMSVDSRRAR